MDQFFSPIFPLTSGLKTDMRPTLCSEHNSQIELRLFKIREEEWIPISSISDAEDSFFDRYKSQYQEAEFEINNTPSSIIPLFISIFRQANILASRTRLAGGNTVLANPKTLERFGFDSTPIVKSRWTQYQYKDDSTEKYQNEDDGIKKFDIWASSAIDRNNIWVLYVERQGNEAPVGIPGGLKQINGEIFYWKRPHKENLLCNEEDFVRVLRIKA